MAIPHDICCVNTVAILMAMNYQLLETCEIHALIDVEYCLYEMCKDFLAFEYEMWL